MNVDDVWPSSHRGPVSMMEWARFRAPGTRKAPEGALSMQFLLGRKLERAKGFEPSTPTLARLCSTPELHPRSAMPWHRCEAVDVPQNGSHCKRVLAIFSPQALSLLHPVASASCGPSGPR